MPAHDTTASLRSLRDDHLITSDPAGDVRGRTVLDHAGAAIGHVDEVLVDDRAHTGRFLRVAAGGFGGIGAATFLVPVEAITKVEEKIVHVDQARDHVAAGPRDAPALIDQPYLDGVSGYDGYGSTWGN